MPTTLTTLAMLTALTALGHPLTRIFPPASQPSKPHVIGPQITLSILGA